MNSRKILSWAAVLLLAGANAFGQTAITGDLVGRVTDQTGAVVPGATVTLKSLEEGGVQTAKTDRNGAFRFSLLRPGVYKLNEEGSGLSSEVPRIAVSVGQETTANMVATPSGNTMSIEVTAEPLLQTEDANISTSFSPREMDALPIPGGDISNLPFSTPGANLSTGDDYGNFTMFGLPGVSNLFTTNGSDLMDAYLNLPNSGASNNVLGANELQEAVVVVNGYTGEYGRLAGAQVNFTTRSGTNNFHGNALLYYNSSGFNANDWFLKEQEVLNGTLNAQPHAVSRQWGGRIGGPIWRNKFFFFFDDEGLRYVLPGGGSKVYVPSPNFQKATLANIAATQPAESAFYTNIFKVYTGASGFATSVPYPSTVNGAATDGGCGDLNGDTLDGITFGPSNPCANYFVPDVNNLNTEQLYSVRLDANLSPADQINARFKHDWGVQATSTSPINNAFSANSVQPEFEGQMNETHIFSSKVVNTATIASTYYSAIFGPPDYAAAIAVFPSTFNFTAGAPFFSMGNGLTSYPQGRNVSVYQVIDDLSINRGIHNFKMGFDFKRDNITNYATESGIYGSTTFNTNADFYNGLITSAGASTTSEPFPQFAQVHIALYDISVYFQDQMAVTPKLKLTASLRFDRQGNPNCGGDCFVRLNGPFPSITHSTVGTPIPYSASILTGQSNAFPSVEAVTTQPRVGFAWAPFGPTGKTVIRGGLGLFADLPVADVLTRFVTSAPNDPSFTVTPNTANPSYTVDPALATSSYASAAKSSAAFQTGFKAGETLPQIQAAVAAAGSSFSPPSYTASTVSNLRNPKFVEYNFEVQQAVSRRDVIDINYVGNFGTDILFVDPTENGYQYCATDGRCPNGYPDVPVTQPDNRFLAVSTLTNEGHSNYNGLVASFRHQSGYGLTTALNYTYSHALDNTSNGGIEGASAEATYIQSQIVPGDPNVLNYGSADYDVRHNFSTNFVWQPPVSFQNRLMTVAASGWSLSGTMFAKSGVAYSVVRGSLTSYFFNSTDSGSILGGFLGGAVPSCRNPRTTCLTLSQFAANSTATRAQQAAYGFGNQARNSYRGPGYFNADMQISKETPIGKFFGEGARFKFGGNIFNILNHPNFAPPVNNIASSTFGTIQDDIPPVSSPYGNFQGAGVSGRIIQVMGGITF